MACSRCQFLPKQNRNLLVLIFLWVKYGNATWRFSNGIFKHKNCEQSCADLMHLFIDISLFSNFRFVCHFLTERQVGDKLSWINFINRHTTGYLISTYKKLILHPSFVMIEQLLLVLHLRRTVMCIHENRKQKSAIQIRCIFNELWRLWTASNFAAWSMPKMKTTSRCQLFLPSRQRFLCMQCFRMKKVKSPGRAIVPTEEKKVSLSICVGFFLSFV